jgi:hypothetical protein
MTSRVLIDAVLDRPPVRLTSKAGKRYLRASARDGKGPDAKWWTVFVFGETAIEALEALTVGEAFAASGPFEANIWATEGREPRINLSMNADAILSARKPKPTKPKSHEKSPNTDGRSIASKSWAAPARAEVETPLAEKGAFDDEIPF